MRCLQPRTFLPQTFLFQKSSFALVVLLTLAPTPLFAQFAPASGHVLSLPADGENFDDMGRAVARGDFNGDGFDDLAVGVPDESVEGAPFSGAVYIYFGEANGLLGVTPARLAQPNGGDDCGGPETSDRFGSSLAVGELDGTDWDDLIVGAPGKDFGGVNSVGAFFIFFGINKGPDPFLPFACFPYGDGVLPGDPVLNAEFGSAIAVGNFNSDDYEDIAIGAPGASVDGKTGAGTVTVIYGSECILDFASAQLLHQDVPGMPGIAEARDRFGESLATGDLVLGLDVDCDLVIGAPFDDLEGTAMDPGAVHVIFGCTEDGLDPVGSVRWTPFDFFGDGPTFEDWRLGRQVAVGNMDCTGAQDLAISAYTPGTQGAVALVYGNQQGPDVELDAITHADFGSNPNLFQIGAGLLTFPFSEDACQDLIIGAPGESSIDESTVFVLEGVPGQRLDPAAALPYRLDEEFVNSAIGVSLAAGRFDGKNISLAIGAPDYNSPDGDTKDGGVWILPSADLFADDFESGDPSAWNVVIP